ncbi:MAG: P-II family nitrogen regulator [Clostridia bacterium]|nr:P-II family nitrogen regulator [Clostridia bacterium]
MKNFVMMVTIGMRNESEVIRQILVDNKVTMALARFGRGTATNEIMDYLGMEDKEKCVIFSTMAYQKSKLVMREIGEKNTTEKKHKIISFTVPITSVGGQSSMDQLIGNSKEEEEKMEMDKNNEVIIVIANRGYVDLVMDAARDAGAKGGTVVHARGTGLEQSEKFFGVTIGAEKEMIYIVTNKETKSGIMKAIMEKAGSGTPAEAILFSVPVVDVEGIR